LNSDVEWHFHRNGTLSVSVKGQPNHSHTRPWRVEGQSLLIGNEFVQLDSQLDRLNDRVEEWTGHLFFLPVVQWDIRQIDSTTMRLFCSDANEGFELHRIPDYQPVTAK
jgi:hypothetical protein